MRYEVAVRSNVVFHTQLPPYPGGQFPPPETVVIEFEGRRFVWHEVPPRDGEEMWPVVTTMVANSDDYATGRLAMERFLSALSFWTNHPIEVLTAGGSGGATEMDRPVVNARRRGYGNSLYEAPLEVVITDDASLKRVFGYYRDALNTGSPFFRFLGFWNALDVACEDYNGGLPAWIRATAPAYAHRISEDERPADWWHYLQNDRRRAIPHAVRDPDRGEELDPDDPEDQGRLGRDARLLEDFVRERVRQRWPDYPIWVRRRERP